MTILQNSLIFEENSNKMVEKKESTKKNKFF